MLAAFVTVWLELTQFETHGRATHFRAARAFLAKAWIRDQMRYQTGRPGRTASCLMIDRLEELWKRMETARDDRELAATVREADSDMLREVEGWGLTMDADAR